MAQCVSGTIDQAPGRAVRTLTKSKGRQSESATEHEVDVHASCFKKSVALEEGMGLRAGVARASRPRQNSPKAPRHKCGNGRSYGYTSSLIEACMYDRTTDTET